MNVIYGSGITAPGCSSNHPGEHVSVCVHMQGRRITAFWTWRNHACLSVRLPRARSLMETHCHLPGIGGSFKRPSSCRSGSFWVKLPSTASSETDLGKLEASCMAACHPTYRLCEEKIWWWKFAEPPPLMLSITGWFKGHGDETFLVVHIEKRFP